MLFFCFVFVECVIAVSVCVYLNVVALNVVDC